GIGNDGSRITAILHNAGVHHERRFVNAPGGARSLCVLSQVAHGAGTSRHSVRAGTYKRPGSARLPLRFCVTPRNRHQRRKLARSGGPATGPSLFAKSTVSVRAVSTSHVL